MAISTKGQNMQRALKEIVVPFLREQGFKGSYPHFRRPSESQIDLISFQTSSLGGGRFTINLGISPPEGITTPWKQVPANKVTVHDVKIENKERLTMDDNFGDHWFIYESPGQSNNFDTFCKDCDDKFIELANTALELIKRRAFIILEKISRRIKALETVTSSELSELELLINDNYKNIRSKGHMQYIIERKILDYLDGTFQAQVKALNSMTSCELSTLETTMRRKYPELNYDKMDADNKIDIMRSIVLDFLSKK